MFVRLLTTHRITLFPGPHHRQPTPPQRLACLSLVLSSHRNSLALKNLHPTTSFSNPFVVPRFPCTFYRRLP